MIFKISLFVLIVWSMMGGIISLAEDKSFLEGMKVIGGMIIGILMLMLILGLPFLVIGFIGTWIFDCNFGLQCAVDTTATWK